MGREESIGEFMRTLIMMVVVWIGCYGPSLHAQNKDGQPSQLLGVGTNNSPDIESRSIVDIPMNAVFAELGGSALLGSINYERMISNSVGVRIGYGGGIPLLVNYYVGRKYRFEMGAGVLCNSLFAPIVKLGAYGSTVMTMTVGHKYQPTNSAVMVRFSLTPFYSLASGNGFFMIGISVGYAY
jgi:hypothetical protein